jgi:hypothetical protein
MVDVVAEGAWFRWMFTDRRPSPQSYPIHVVWVE